MCWIDFDFSNVINWAHVWPHSQVSDFGFGGFFLELLVCLNGSIWLEWGREGDQQLFFVGWPHSVVICNTFADGKH